MLSIRRLAAGSTVLLLVFAVAAPAVAACAGWSMAPGDRHTCCAHLGDLASGESMTDYGMEHDWGIEVDARGPVEYKEIEP